MEKLVLIIIILTVFSCIIFYTFGKNQGAKAQHLFDIKNGIPSIELMPCASNEWLVKLLEDLHSQELKKSLITTIEEEGLNKNQRTFLTKTTDTYFATVKKKVPK